MRNNSARRSNCGAFPFFSSGAVPCAFLPAGRLPGFGLRAVGDTAVAADRIRPSASGKTRSHPVPAADEKEVRTHEVREDDVPGEYLDKE